MPSSYRKYQERLVVQDLKENCCMVPQAPSQDGAVSDVDDVETADQQASYELPDGTKVQVDQSLRHIPGKVIRYLSSKVTHTYIYTHNNKYTYTELLMVAKSKVGGGGKETDSSDSSRETPPPQDLPGLVYAAVEDSDVDMRKELLGNVLLTGGGSLFRGASERLHSELTEKLPTAYKVKVVTASLLERKFSVWIGGSILASLGSFQQLWLSKAEYEEMGAERACVERFH